MRRSLLNLALLTCFLLTTTGTALAADVFGDAGPKADVAGVRAARLHKPTPATGINGIHVYGDYAYVSWSSPESDAFSIYKRTSGENWKIINDGGGVALIGDMVKAGVPKSAAMKICSGWPKDFTPCQDESGHPVH